MFIFYRKNLSVITANLAQSLFRFAFFVSLVCFGLLEVATFCIG